MITNGVLTYGQRNGDIFSWRFSNDVLNELVIAALLTILSYQGVEIVINLCFGMKHRGQAKLRDLQIMLLIRKSSPLAVLKSVFSTRPANTTEEDDWSSQGNEREAIHPHVYLKLLCLLIAIPLVNVGTVVLSLERETNLTFADANFGGLALGLNLQQSISEWFPVSSTCEGTALQTSTADFAIAEFYICELNIPESQFNRNNTISIKARGSISHISVSVGIGLQKVEYVKQATLLSRVANTSNPDENRRLYFVQNNLSEEDGDVLIGRGLRLAAMHCDSIEGPAQSENKSDGEEWARTQSLGCRRSSERSENEDLDSVRAVALELLGLLSFVNSEKLLVKDGNSQNIDDVLAERFFPGDDLLLLKRRRGYMSIPLLGLAAFGVMLLRIISELTTRNDLERGIGLIVRDGLGLPCCDSMLSSADVVARYDSTGSILYAVERNE